MGAGLGGIQSRSLKMTALAHLPAYGRHGSIQHPLPPSAAKHVSSPLRFSEPQDETGHTVFGNSGSSLYKGFTHTVCCK